MIGAGRARAVTLIELLVALLILVVLGTGLLQFVRTSYSAQDSVSGWNSAMGGARLALDALADNIRNAQWCNPYDSHCTGCTGTAAEAVVDAQPSSITVYQAAAISGDPMQYQTVQYQLTNGSLTKSVSGGTPVAILSGVQSLTFTYYRASDWAAITPATSDYPGLGAVGISAAVSVTQMGTYTRAYSTFVRLRNSPPAKGL